MQSLNRVFLCGNLGHDPEVRLSKNGRSYCRLNIATNKSYRDPEDTEKWVKQTEWHSVFVWGEMADRAAHNYRKGCLVFVEGSLSYWKVAQSSDTAYKNAIQAERVMLIHDPRGRGETAPTEETVDLDNPPGARNHNAVAHPA